MAKIGERLRDKRRSLGLNLKDAATLAGFSNLQVLSKIERGIREIKAYELVNIAKAYSFDLNLFFLHESGDIGKTQVFWRAEKQSPKDREFENKLQMFVERYWYLQKLIEGAVSRLKLSWITQEVSTIERAAELGEHYGNMLNLGDRPALTFRRILEEEFNLPILYLDMPEKTSAISLIAEHNAAICVNKNDAPWRRNFDIAHELFHVLYKLQRPTKCGKSNTEIQEMYANAFAAALLLPRRALENDIQKRIAKSKLQITDLAVMACEYDVSMDAFLWRLVNLGKITRSRVEKIFNLKAVKSYCKSLRTIQKDTAPYLSEKYVCMVFKAVSEGMMSEARAAEYLDVPVGDIDRVFAQAGLVRTGELNIEITV